MEAPIILIREYRKEDDEQVKKVIYDGTMAPVNEFFKQALFREGFIQGVVMICAILFICTSLHFYYCIISTIPLTIVLTYISIYLAHFYKAKCLHPDLKNIQNIYMTSKTTFLIAEAFYLQDQKHKPLIFVTESEFEQLDRNGQMTLNEKVTKEIVGTCAVCRDRDSALTAWLRRMAVKKAWRGKGIGSNLLDRIIKFASKKAFHSVELITTECHSDARKLYLKKGFQVQQFFHKKFLNLSTLAIPMYYMSYATRPLKGTTLES